MRGRYQGSYSGSYGDAPDGYDAGQDLADALLAAETGEIETTSRRPSQRAQWSPRSAYREQMPKRLHDPDHEAAHVSRNPAGPHRAAPPPQPDELRPQRRQWEQPRAHAGAATWAPEPSAPAPAAPREYPRRSGQRRRPCDAQVGWRPIAEGYKPLVPYPARSLRREREGDEPESWKSSLLRWFILFVVIILIAFSVVTLMDRSVSSSERGTETWDTSVNCVIV